MIYAQNSNAASFFEYRDAVAHDFQQFHVTITKQVRKRIAQVKSAYSDVFSFSGINCLSDEEPVKMSAAQIARAQIDSVGRYFVLAYKRHVELRSLRTLAGLSDNALKDIGFTREDISYVKTLPLNISPAEELNRINRQIHNRLA